MIDEHQSNSGGQSVTALPKAAEREFGEWRITLNIRLRKQAAIRERVKSAGGYTQKQ